MDRSKYRNQLVQQISKIIEVVGANDKEYNNELKSLDILDSLESIIAYAICNISVDIGSIRDASEESYVNIKRKAIAYYRKNAAKNK